MKGLYKKALAGEIRGFTGVDDPYEEPLAPDVVIESGRELVEFSTLKIINELEQRELVPKNRDLSQSVTSKGAIDGHDLEIFDSVLALA